MDASNRPRCSESESDCKVANDGVECADAARCCDIDKSGMFVDADVGGVLCVVIVGVATIGVGSITHALPPTGFDRMIGEELAGTGASAGVFGAPDPWVEFETGNVFATTAAVVTGELQADCFGGASGDEVAGGSFAFPEALVAGAVVTGGAVLFGSFVLAIGAGVAVSAPI